MTPSPARRWLVIVEDDVERRYGVVAGSLPDDRTAIADFVRREDLVSGDRAAAVDLDRLPWRPLTVAINIEIGGPA